VNEKLRTRSKVVYIDKRCIIVKLETIVESSNTNIICREERLLVELEENNMYR
jgi:hypothetical protein